MIERYSAAAAEFPGMQDTLASISSALAQLRALHAKVHVLADKGRNRAQSLAAHSNFKSTHDKVSVTKRNLLY